MPRFANMPILTVSMGLAAAVTSATFGFGSGAGEYHFGMLHSSLGGASLGTDPAGRLVISNIGSSGQDGVSVAITEPAPAGGKSPGWAGVLDFGQAGALPQGSRVEVSACDQGGAKLASLSVTGAPGGHCAVGFSSAYCPTCPVTVELRLHGSVVQSSDFMPPLPPVLAIGNIGSQGNDGVEVRVRQKKWLTSNFRFELGMRLPASTPVALMGGTGGLPPVECDELRVSLNGLPPGTRYIGNLSVTASNTPVVVVSSEGLMVHEGVHVAQGGAHVRGVGDLDGDGFADITCDNLGSSGQDGVSVRRGLIPDSSPNVTGEMFSVDEDTHRPPWLRFAANSRSQPGTLPETHALVLTSPGAGSNLTSLSIDKCAPCGPYVTVVEAIRSGVVVDSVTHASPPSSVAMCTFGSSGGGGGGGGSIGSLTAYRQELLDDTGSLGQSMVMECRSPVAGPCTLTGSALGAVTADRVRVRCIPADGTIEPIDSVSMLGNDGPPLVISNTRTRINQLEGTLQALGFAARAVGDTTITPLPDGSLFVRNFLDNDDDGDGVELDIGDYPGAAVSIDLGGGGGGGGAGGFVQLEYKAKQGSTGKTKFYDDQADGAGGPNLIGYENDECPTCPVTVELLNGGTVVASQTYSPPLPPALVSVSFRFQKIEWKYAPQEEHIGYPGVTSMSLTNGATADATCVRISPQGLPSGPPADPVSAVVVSASAGSSFTITNVGGVSTGALGVARRQNSGQLAGKKRVAAQGSSGPDCALVVSNIGSSGQDGVMFVGEDEDCDGHSDLSDEIDATLALTVIPPTSSVAIKSKGLCCPNLLGSSDFETRCTIVGTGTSNDVMVDFTECGAPSYRVRVSNAGATQGVVTGVTAPLAARVMIGGAGHQLTGVTASRRSVGTTTLVWSPQTNLRWSGPVDIQLSNGSVVVGDEITITAENPTSAFAGIESMSLTGSSLPDDRLVIFDYAITPTPISDCPADINGDHNVNVADLLAVISAWGPCPTPPAICPADTNGDHNVNVADLLSVISSWGSCP